MLKCSNPERLDVTPKQMRLQVSQSCKVEVRLNQPKPFHNKATKLKDFLFIKGDYFDQKVQINIFPGQIKSGQISEVSQKHNSTSNGKSLAGVSFGRKAMSSIHNDTNSSGPGVEILRHSFDHTSRDDDADSDDDLNNDYDIMREQVAALSTENNKLKEQLQLNQSELSMCRSSQQHTNSIRELLKEKEPAFERLFEEAMKIENERQQVKEKQILGILQAKDQKINALQSRAAELEQALAQSKRAYEESQSKHTHAQEKIDKLQSSIRQMELRLAESKDLLTDFSGTDLATMQAQILREQQSNKHLQERIRELSNDRHLEQALENLKQEQGLKDLQYKALTEECLELKDRVSNLQQQNQSLVDDRAIAKRTDKSHRQLSQQYDMLNEKLGTLQAQVIQALSDLQQVTGISHSDVSAASAQTVELFQRIQADYQNLEKELQQVAISTQSRHLYGGSEDDLKLENQNLRSQLHERSKELHQMQTFMKDQNDRSTLGSHISHDQPSSTVQTIPVRELPCSNNAIHIQDTLNVSTEGSHNTRIMQLRLDEMKVRENQLIDQISVMKQHMKYQSISDAGFESAVNNLTEVQGESVSDHLQLRIGELEHLCFTQQEQLLQMEETSIQNVRTQQEVEQRLQNQVELLELRNKNLLALSKNKPAELAVYSQSDLFGTLLSKSPQTHVSETERARHAYHTENLELKHKCQELQVALNQSQKSSADAKSKCDQLTLELSKLKHVHSLKEAGLTSHDSYLTNLISDQKQRLQHLENKQSTPHLEDQTVARVRDEFVQKLERLSQAQDKERSALTQQVLAATQKAENQKSQIAHMEKSELKLSKQVVEMRAELSGERSKHQSRLSDIQKVVDAKQARVAELEKELQAKERVVSERQDQISVLLQAVDSANGSSDDQKAKLANLAAEVCNLIADRSSLEKRLSDQQHAERQATSLSQEQESELENRKLQITRLEDEAQSSQALIESLQRKVGQLESSLVDAHNKHSDLSHQGQRTDHELKQAHTQLVQMKEQLSKTEARFKDQVASIKQQVLQHSQQLGMNKPSQSGVSERTLKAAIQKLHLALLEKPLDNRDVITEMETTLGIAASTVVKQQQELERKQLDLQMLEQGWDAHSQNQVLLQRQEALTMRLQSVQQAANARDIEQTTFVKSTIDHKVGHLVQELERQLDGQQLQVHSLQDELLKARIGQKQAANEVKMLQARLRESETEVKSVGEAALLKAELDFDQRHSQRENMLQNYFEQRLAKVVTPSDATSELSRELCAVQLLTQTLKKQLSLEGAKTSALEMQLRTCRKQLGDAQDQSRKEQLNVAKATQKLVDQQTESLQSQENLKKQILRLDKELISQRALANQQAQEIASLCLSQEPQHQSHDGLQAEKSEPLSGQIQHLQEEIIDLRQTRMLEIDELRIHYEFEVAEAKQSIAMREQELERQFQANPTQILDQNEELKQRLAQYEESESNSTNEKASLQRQIADLEEQLDLVSKELEETRHVVHEIEGLTHQQDDGMLRSQGPPPSSLQSSKQSKGASSKKKHVDSQSAFARQCPQPFVQALVQAKLGEIQAKSKLRKQLQAEVFLRQQLAQKQQPTTQEHQSDLLSDLINQNDTILQILQGYNEVYSQAPQNVLHSTPQEQDLSALVQGVLWLSTELANLTHQPELDVSQLHEQMSLSSVARAQRIVIKALSRSKAGPNQNGIRYVPEREHDRKVWLLELLEQQVSDAETQTDRLVDFIKRLQVAVSGNLQSAAEIRATSIDLANNTKECSEEIKTLRHVCALIKHEVQSDSHQQQSIGNPFRDDQQENQQTLNHASLQRSSATNLHKASSVEKLLQEKDSVSNQLSLTAKIKQSLEQELLKDKLSHASELQTHMHQHKHLQLQLEGKCGEVRDLTDKLASFNQMVAEERQQNEILAAKLREQESQNLGLTSKIDKTHSSSVSLKRLQQDMQDWRKTAEGNLKQKQQSLEQSQAELAKVKIDLQKTKSENLMLRRVQADHRSGEQSSAFLKEVELLKKEISTLESQKTATAEEHTTKCSQFESRIAELEQIIDKGDSQASRDVQKLMKRVNLVSAELKQKQADLTALKDQLAKAQIEKVAHDAQLTEAHSRASSLQRTCDDLKQKAASLTAERESLITQKLHALESQDLSQAQILDEMSQLKDTFLKLKQERDYLSEQLQINKEAWETKNDALTAKVHQLEAQHRKLESQTYTRHTEEHESTLVLQERNKALMNDLKYFRDQTEVLQRSMKQLQEKQTMHEAHVLAGQQEQTCLMAKVDEMAKESREQRALVAEKELALKQVKLDLVEAEAQHAQQIKALSSQGTKARYDAQQAAQALSQQVTCLKQAYLQAMSGKAAKDQQRPVKEVDTQLQAIQRDSQLKVIKKELAAERAKCTKLKASKNELKAQVTTLQEQQQTVSLQKNKRAPPVVQASLPKWKEHVLEMLSSDTALKKTLKTLHESSTQECQAIDYQNQLQSMESNMLVQQSQNEELQYRIEELQQAMQEQKMTAKDGKSTLIDKHHAQVQGFKEQVRQLQSELAQIKNEFVSPDETQPLLDQIKEYQSQLKANQSDMSRKAKLVATLRQQKDSLQTEMEITQQDLKATQSDYQRVARQLRDAKHSLSDQRELKENYEWLQRQEKQMKEEMVALHDRNRSLKADLQRKETQVNTLREQVATKGKDAAATKEFVQQLDRLKEDKKRLKLELDICQQQVKTLKEAKLNSASQSTVHHQVSQNLVTSNHGNVEQELKSQRQLSRSLKSSLKRSVQVLSQVGTSLVKMSPSEHLQEAGSSSMKTLSNGSPSNQQLYLRDAGAILGVSMHELEDFINPSPSRKSALEHSSHSTQSQQQLMLHRLSQMQKLPESIDDDIEEIGQYCCKLLDDMQNQH